MVKTKKILVLKHDKLLAIRKAIGLTQVKMASEFGVSPMTYQYWENGLNNPRYESIDKITLWLEKYEDALKEKGLPYKVDDLFKVESKEIEEEDNPYLFLGFKLKKLRQDMNMKQSDYAQVLDVFYATISKWERGATFCNFEYGKKIATTFGIANFMELYVLKEDVYSLILGEKIPARYAMDFIKEGLVDGVYINEDGVLSDENGDKVTVDVHNLHYNEERLRDLEHFKLLKLYRYYLDFDV